MLGGETVFHEPWIRDEKNAHGQKLPVYAAPVRVDDTGVDVPDVSEPRDGTTRNVRYDYRLFLPPGTTIRDKDRVTVRGHVCEVEEAGEPLPNMFTGMVFRTEVTVRRVDP